VVVRRQRVNLHIIGSPILENGSTSWDPCRERQISALDRIQKYAAQFIIHTKDLDCEHLAQPRMITRLYVSFKTYSVERGTAVAQWISC